MTVYAELLKLAMADDDLSEQSLHDMVTEAQVRRTALAHPGDPATRLAAALAYDSVLVRLCGRLGVDHDLTGDGAGPEARRRAEQVLAAVLPPPHVPQ